MKVKYVFPVEDLRGKSGGVSGLVASDWRGIKTMRTFVTPRNPQSTDQVLVRSYLSQCSKAYPGIDETDKADWEIVARNCPQNILGKEVILPANSLFVRMNFFKLLGGMIIDEHAPEHYIPNYVVSSISEVGIDLTTNALQFKVTHTGGSNEKVAVYMTPMFTSGIRTVHESDYRLICGADPANESIKGVTSSGSTVTFTALRTTVTTTGYFGIKIYPLSDELCPGTPYYFYGQAAEL